MDELDRACTQALQDRRAAYKKWRHSPSPRTYAAYEAAFVAWEQIVAPGAARQESWQAQPRRSPLAALKNALRPARRKVMAPR